MKAMILGIPTIRPQAYRTAAEYAANLRQYGHADTTILVSDDALPGNSSELTEGLAHLAADHPELTIAYLGPQEKAMYLARLEEKVRSASRLLGRGYGGNRNWLLLASFGGHLLSVDDDVHPFGILRLKELPLGGTALRGAFVRPEASEHLPKVPFDILSSYRSMLGHSVASVVRHWNDSGQCLTVGSHLQDSNADLVLNTTLKPFQPSTVQVVGEGACPRGRIGMVQTYLSGDPDLDTKDLVAEYLLSGDGEVLKGRPPYRFVLDGFRPCVLDHDYRITCAVLGLDNSGGTIPFIPTRLRLEDFLLRAYSRQEGIHVGYCAAVQTHLRAMTSRNHIVADAVNEGLATLLKTMIQAGLCGTGPLQFQFEARPESPDRGLQALWASLVEPLNNPESRPGAWRSSSWELFRSFVWEQVLDLEDPGPFIGQKRGQLLDAYADLRTTMELWPRVLAFAERVPLRPRTLHPTEASHGFGVRAS